MYFFYTVTIYSGYKNYSDYNDKKHKSTIKYSSPYE